MPADKYEDGMKVRRAVLGDAHVDRATAQASDLDSDFQKLITETAWGSVWNREGLSRRERSMLTIALLIAGGHEDELAMHIRACERTGCSWDDIREVILHSAIYAGIPAANGAFKVANEIYRDSQGDDT